VGETVSERDEALDRLDELSNDLDWRWIQEGDDLSWHNPKALGYHWTSERALKDILRVGLGRDPGWVADHEIPYWAVIYLHPDDAVRVIDMMNAHHVLDATHEVVRLLKKIQDLKVMWFFRSRDDTGSIAAANDRRIAFNLQALGDWLAEHGSDVASWSGQDIGYAVAWIGPPIPVHLLKQRGA